MLIAGAAKAVFETAGIPDALPTGDPDPGVIVSAGGDNAALDAFVNAVAKHRHYMRESDPPAV